ncbi:hypothetical protein H311_04610, partial [Anncaliia algerae PRA109]
RCKQYGIVDQDCRESVYYPRQEYDNFLRSFKMPIQKDPECEKQKCFVNVNDVSSIIQVIPKNIPNPICIDKPKSTASPKKGTKIQKQEEKVVTVIRPIYSTITVSDPITLYREITTTITSEVPIINYKVTTITEKESITKTTTCLSTETKTNSVTTTESVYTTIFTTTTDSFTSTKTLYQSIFSTELKTITSSVFSTFTTEKTLSSMLSTTITEKETQSIPITTISTHTLTSTDTPKPITTEKTTKSEPTTSLSTNTIQETQSITLDKLEEA